MTPGYDKKQVIAWALYDWANSAFVTTVMAGFFPLFFKQYWSAGADVTVSTFRLGVANSLASIVVALLAPVLGAIADRGHTRKRFLLGFALLGMVMTGGLFGVGQGAWDTAIILYVLATVGFSGGNIFYDALLVTVADMSRRDMVSALGFALGYLGGGILFAWNVVMTLYPSFFGLASASEAVRVSFLSVALWWGLFSLPLFSWVKESNLGEPSTGWGAVRAGWTQLRATFQDVRQLRVVFLFLLGYWLYIDGVDTIVRMAIDYGMSLGLQAQDLIVALLVTQFVGFPAAIAFGKLGEKIGAKRGIFLGLGVYVGVTLWGFFLRQEWEFYALAIAIGLVQGGVQALSRSLYTRLIPENKATEFFGFYNMLGKFAAVIGPTLMGGVGVLTGNPRYAVFSILILFLGGAFFLSRVDIKEGQQMARRLANL
ncbi:MAG: MFS transporter [Nitrospinota bacterium]|nr:MAG: MFS transporter [Nitrospinota bacterium]